VSNYISYYFFHNAQSAGWNFFLFNAIQYKFVKFETNMVKVLIPSHICSCPQIFKKIDTNFVKLKMRFWFFTILCFCH